MNHKILCLMAAALCVVACSDDEDDVLVTETLPTPGSVSYTADTNSLHFEWGAVENAASYEATLAPSASPSSTETVSTTSTQCDFDGLTEGTSYVFTLTAISGSSKYYDSEPYSTTVSTLGGSGSDEPEPDEPDEPEVTEPLAAPADLWETTVGGQHFVVNWEAVSGAAAYRVTAAATAEAFNEVVTETTCDVTGLDVNTTYTVSVQALCNATGEASEFDSELKTIEVATKNALIAPTIETYLTTHGIAIMEWFLSDEALAQQAQGDNDDPYDMSISDANGNILRTISEYIKFRTQYYPWRRYVWGGLDPNTTYILGVRRIVSDLAVDAGFENSDWVYVTATTTAAPDKSGYLLYWDFENVPFFANSQYGAYGSNFSADSSTNYDNPWNITITNAGNSETIYQDRINPGSNGKWNQSFFDNYLPGVKVEDFTVDNVTNNIGVGPGMMKFGGSSAASWLTLPAVDIEDDTDILVEFDSCPLVSCTSAGSMMGSIDSGADVFSFEVIGDGTIDASSLLDGESVDADCKIATLKNPSVSDMTNMGLSDHYYFLPHAVVVKGANSETRIKLYPNYVSGQLRMWMDNIKISVNK